MITLAADDRPKSRRPVPGAGPPPSHSRQPLYELIYGFDEHKQQVYQELRRYRRHQPTGILMFTFWRRFIPFYDKASHRDINK
jgi:hypothetical protein